MFSDVGIYHNDLLRNCNYGIEPDIQGDNYGRVATGKVLHLPVYSCHHTWSQSACFLLRLCGLFLKTRVLFHHNRHTLEDYCYKLLEFQIVSSVAKLSHISVFWLNPLHNVIDEVPVSWHELLRNEYGSKCLHKHCAQCDQFVGIQGKLVSASDIHELWRYILHGSQTFVEPYRQYNTKEIKYQIT